jgi:hypothetical protein
MTSDQSSKLQVGTSVCFNGDSADIGTVKQSTRNTSRSNGTMAMKALRATVR